MINHLFIGLGGQGCRTLAELRKVMAQRDRDTEALSTKIRWDFLAIDSSTDVRNELKCWNYFGTDLSLKKNDWVALDSLSPEDVDTLALRADVAPWIGNRGQIKAFLAGTRIEGANQRRRFGRLLFAHNATRIRQAIFGQKVETLTSSGYQQCAFHIFASLAGGTGSGCLVDTITSIRAMYPNSDIANGFPIFVYLYVTHNEGEGKDVGYFYQNQFATLRDLNALMCNRLAPNLLGPQVAGERYSGTDPSAQVVLTTSLNRKNIRVPLPTQIRMVAESCFERIYAWNTGQMDAVAQQSITGQDVLASFQGEPTQQPERSYRFAGFGMRRWEVPNAKIKELLALDLLARSLRQMIFNHWPPKTNEGYTATLPNLPKAMGDACSEGLDKMVKEYLLVPDRAAELAGALREEIDQLIEGMQRESGGNYDLDALEPKIRSYYERTFQAEGVASYFQGLNRGQGGQLDEAIERIDKGLSAFWLDAASPMALAHLPDLIESLNTALRGKLENQEQLSTDGDGLARRRASRKLEWNKITRLSALVGKQRVLFLAHARDCTMGHILNLQRRCGEVDESFIRSLLGKLQVLKAGYESARDSLMNLLEETERERDGIYNDLRDLQRESGANKYEFDQDALDKFLGVMRTHKLHQFDCASALRKTISDFLNEGPLTGLRNPSARISEQLDESLRKTAKAKAEAIHADLAMKNAAPQILGDSLLNRLEERFRGNDTNLLNEVAEFVKLAATCMHCREGEKQPMTLLGRKVGVSIMPRRVLVLGLPGQGHNYVAKLREAFEGCKDGGEKFVFSTYTHNDSTQLRLFFVDYWMAARFTTVANELSKSYHQVAEGRKTSDTAYFCNIDSDGENGKRPSLFLPTSDEMRTRYEAELWLGKQLKASSREDEQSHLVMDDANGVFLIDDDDEGNRSSEKLANPNMALEMADDQKMFALHGAICGAVARLAGDRNKFVESVIQAENVRYRGRETSPEFQHWMKMREHINQLIR